MRSFGSLCSGIEAASIAFAPLGWTASWLSEVDVQASQSLAHRYGATAPVFPLDPEEEGIGEKERKARLNAIKNAARMTWGKRLTNWGDMTAVRAMIAMGEAEAPEILVAGCPCQSFSIAGLRRGLGDSRGNLTLEYVRIVDAVDRRRRFEGKEPCVTLFENVPGILNHRDNPFGCLLAGLAGEDVPLVPAGRKWTNAGLVLGPKRAVAWRVLDAQYFGLAQRRARVFVVASAREGFDPAEVLLEFDGLRRDSAPSRSAGEGFAADLAPCLTGSGRGVERTGDPRGQDAVVAQATYGPDLSKGYRLVSFGEYADDDLASTMQSRDYKYVTDIVATAFQVSQSGVRLSDVHATLDANNGPRRHNGIVYAIQAGALRTNPDSGPDGMGVQEDQAYTLEARSEVQCVAYGFQQRIGRNGRGDMGEIVNALTAEAGETGKGDAAPCVAYSFPAEMSGTQFASKGDLANALSVKHLPAICFAAKDYGGDATEELAPTMRAMNFDGSHANGGGQLAVCVTGEITHALTSEGFDASEDGTGRGNPIVPVEVLPFDTTQITSVRNRSNPRWGSVCHTMSSKGDTPAIFQKSEGVIWSVRRLMPVECERLMGFPDNSTLALPDGKEAADGPRYRQLGNSWAIPCVAWIGRRIELALRGESLLPRARTRRAIEELL